MTNRPERRRLIDIIAEAALFGLICVISVVAFMFVRRKNLGWADYEFLIPTFFVGGGVVYAAGMAIAGRLGGAFVGSFLGLVALGQITQAMVDPGHVMARLVGPGVGFIAGAVLGAVVERAIRGAWGTSCPQSERTG